MVTAREHSAAVAAEEAAAAAAAGAVAAVVAVAAVAVGAQTSTHSRRWHATCYMYI